MKSPDGPSKHGLALVQRMSVTYFPEGNPPVRALDEASLKIQTGERVGILGESGSGKSTLAAAIMRLLPSDTHCDSEALRFRGIDLSSLPEVELREIRGPGMALIPQDPALALNPVISVGDQIAEVLRAHMAMTRPDRRSRVEELLGECGFNDPGQIYNAYPHQLSGGQRQRIVIAQAMACRPALVIADEATSKLDACLQGEMLSLMRDISQRHETAFVLISHDPAVLAGFVDRVAIMYAGRIIEEGSTEDIFRRPLHPYTQALVRLCGRYLPGAGARNRFATIDGEPPDLTRPGVGCPFAARCPERMHICVERDVLETMPQPSHRVSCFKYDN